MGWSGRVWDGRVRDVRVAVWEDLVMSNLGVRVRVEVGVFLIFFI